MDQIIIKAPAKINWSLEVTGKRTDGYHLICSVMQTIDLFDTVMIKKSNFDRCDGIANIPIADNLAFKAWLLMKNKYNLPGNIAISIEKNIPMGGGLAGGSADAAAVFRGVNELFDLGLTYNQLADIAIELGADIPFCIHGGLALAEGIGEKLTKLAINHQYRLLLANPNISINTAQVFKAFDNINTPIKPDIKAIATAIINGDKDKIIDCAGNMLEPAAYSLEPKINELKKLISETGLTPIMSGSGATIIGIARNDIELINAERYLSNIVPWIRIVETLPY